MHQSFAPPSDGVGEQWIRFFWDPPEQFQQEAFEKIKKYLIKKECEVRVAPEPLTEATTVMYARTCYDRKILDAIRQEVCRSKSGMQFRQAPEPFFS